MTADLTRDDVLESLREAALVSLETCLALMYVLVMVSAAHGLYYGLATGWYDVLMHVLGLAVSPVVIMWLVRDVLENFQALKQGGSPS